MGGDRFLVTTPDRNNKLTVMKKNHVAVTPFILKHVQSVPRFQALTFPIVNKMRFEAVDWASLR